MPVQIYQHNDPITSPLIPALISHLPHSISLLRRIQHGLSHPAPTAKILATFPQAPSGSESESAPADSTPWLAARVDLFRGRETQIILYSSLEAHHTSIQPIVTPCPEPQSRSSDSEAETSSTSTPGTSTGTGTGTFRYRAGILNASQDTQNLVRDQLLALLSYVKTNLLPEYLASLDLDLSASRTVPVPTPGVALIPPPDPRAFLIGTLHTGLYTLFLESGVFPCAGASENENEAALIPSLRVHRYDNPPYDKFFFPRKVFTDSEGEIVLPDGYRFHDKSGRSGVLDSQLDLVQSRTHIPRSRAQLSVMPGAAIYWDGVKQQEGEEEMPIAWAFLGLDGALASLYVEEEHRGKGLALPLTRETMRRGMDPKGVFGVEKLGLGGRLADELNAWVHTEVAQYNPGSRRVMQKAGGEVLSTVMWTVIELVE